LGPIPNPQSPIPNPQSPYIIKVYLDTIINNFSYLNGSIDIDIVINNL
jgi:hypothetical protein